MAEILICDDDIELMNILAEWLEIQGHSASTINKPELVKTTLLSRPFDLLIIDHDMPKMTGQEVLEEIRDIFTTAELPVAFFTGHSQKDLVFNAVKYGVTGYFMKPLNFESAQAKIPQLLPRRLNIKEVRAMMETGFTADRNLAKEPGLNNYLGSACSLYPVVFEDVKYILATSDAIRHPRLQLKFSDGEIYMGVTVYVQQFGKWVRVFPTIWQRT
jgi:DNA-binding NtrC family response regulator